MAMLLGCQEEVISAQQFVNIKQFINSERKSSSVNVPSNTNSSLCASNGSQHKETTSSVNARVVPPLLYASKLQKSGDGHIRVTSTEASPAAASTPLADPQLEPVAPPGSGDSFPSQQGRTASRSQVLQADFIEI